MNSEHIVGELIKGFVKSRKLEDDFQEKLREIDPIMGQVLGDKLQGAFLAISNSGNSKTFFMLVY